MSIIGRRGRPPGSKNKHPSRRKSTPPRKAEEHVPSAVNIRANR